MFRLFHTLAFAQLSAIINSMKTNTGKKIPPPANKTALFLGLDFSTQRLKATTVDDTGVIVHDAAVEFDADLPAFKTHGGVHRGSDGLTVTSPSIMWVAALELLFNRLAKADYPFARIAAISGSGQQHGSVYWRKGASEILANLSQKSDLVPQFAGAFSVENSPVWMDFPR